VFDILKAYLAIFLFEVYPKQKILLRLLLASFIPQPLSKLEPW